jgi:hypothetical protein
MSGGRPGLMYYRKIPTALSPVDHLATIMRSALQACRLLEKDARMRFNLDDFNVFANDRLNAPNSEEAFLALQPVLSPALAQVFEGAQFQLVRASLDPKERLTVACRHML